VVERKRSDKRSRKGSRQVRRAELQDEARAILGGIAGFLADSRITYPDGPPMRYLRALLDMAEDDTVRHKAAWMLEQRSRFPAQRPQDVILRCMHLAARNVAEHRAAMKPQEVEERRATLLEIVVADRAEAKAAADLGYREHALELEADAADIETLANSLYREDDPAIVTYRNCDEDSAEALALGTLRTLARSLAIMHASPMAGVAAAFTSAAAGATVTRGQARPITGRPAHRRKTAV
jgi:hypothetical protein